MTDIEKIELKGTTYDIENDKAIPLSVGDPYKTKTFYVINGSYYLSNKAGTSFANNKLGDDFILIKDGGIGGGDFPNVLNDTWETKANMPYSRYHVSSVLSGDDFYTTGGEWFGSRPAGHHNTSCLILKYNIPTDTWSKLPDATAIGTRGNWHNVMVHLHNNNLYLIGANLGGGYYSALWRWDLSNNVATHISQVPDQEWVGASVLYNGKIYVFGGGRTNKNHTRVYTIATNTWSTVASMSDENKETAVVVGDKAYMPNVKNTGDSDKHNQLRIYDFKLNAWSTGAKNPRDRGSCAVGNIGGDVLIFGGGSYTKQCDAYSIATNTWRQIKDLPTGLSWFKDAGIASDANYVFGGASGYGSATNKTYKYS